MDGRLLDPQAARAVHDDTRTAAVVAEGAFVGIDRAHGGSSGERNPVSRTVSGPSIAAVSFRCQ